MMEDTFALPPALREGDTVAIVSPASKIDPALIDSAAARLEAEGLRVRVMPHAKGVSGSFSGTAAERLADMTAALEDDRVRCILCSRGGYGAVHLLEGLDRLPERMFGKWLVGFSDITALHALWRRKGVASLHAAMARHIGMGEAFPSFGAELALLRGAEEPCSWEPHPYNRTGEASGMLVGGNMAVLGGLWGTPFFPVREGSILVVEDVAEPIYKVERMMWQLRLSGVLERLGALVVGQFTEYRPSADWQTMEDMLRHCLEGYNFPVSFGAPFGHIDNNRPLTLGRSATLKVRPGSVTLEYGSPEGQLRR